MMTEVDILKLTHSGSYTTDTNPWHLDSDELWVHAGTHFITQQKVEEWVSVVGGLRTEMVYLPTGGQQEDPVYLVFRVL